MCMRVSIDRLNRYSLFHPFPLLATRDILKDALNAFGRSVFQVTFIFFANYSALDIFKINYYYYYTEIYTQCRDVAGVRASVDIFTIGLYF